MTFAPYPKTCVDQLLTASYNDPRITKDSATVSCNGSLYKICSTPDHFDKSRYNMFTLWKCQGDNWQNTKLGNQQIQAICSGDYLNNPDCMYYCNNKTGEQSCDSNIYEYCKNPDNYDKPVCACYMPESFYQNIVGDLNKTFKTNLSYNGNPACIYPKCTRTTLKPEVIRNKTCSLNITDCIDDIKVDGDGHITETPALKSKDCLQPKTKLGFINLGGGKMGVKELVLSLLILLIIIFVLNKWL